MAPNKLMMIVVLAAILLAGVGAVGFMYFSSTPSAPAQPSSLTSSSVPSSTDQATSNGSAFNTTVLQGSAYSALDIGLVTQGRLPVVPPAGTGKADPFQ